MLRIFSVITGYINVLINNIDIEKGYIKIVMKITGFTIATACLFLIYAGITVLMQWHLQLELMCRISIVAWHACYYCTS